MARQTAVEWIYSHLFPKQLDGFSDKEWGKIDKAFEQAKQIEKEQIIQARSNGITGTLKGYAISNEEYYNETYVNK